MKDKKRKNRKIRVYDMLPEGKENAINLKRISNYFGITERDTFRMIQLERQEGYPIMAKKNEGGGYYKPASPEEYIGFLNSWTRQIKTMLDIRSALALNFEEQYKESPYITTM